MNNNLNLKNGDKLNSQQKINNSLHLKYGEKINIQDKIDNFNEN